MDARALRRSSSQDLDKIRRSGVLGKARGSAGLLMKNLKETSTQLFSSVATKGTDIGYITMRLLVMSTPSEGLDSEAVLEYLTARHDDNFLIFNLSSSLYDKERFLNKVVDCGWSLRAVPSLKDLFNVCRLMHSFLEKNGKAVAVLQCDDGKALAAMAVSAYFMYIRVFKTPSPGLRIFIRRRFPNGFADELLQPSQSRYLRYVHRLLAENPSTQLRKGLVVLRKIVMTGIPRFNVQRSGCKPTYEVAVNGETIWTSHNQNEPDQIASYGADQHAVYYYFSSLLVEGDVTISVHHVRALPGGNYHGLNMSLSSVRMFQIQFHTAFIPPGCMSLSFKRSDLDGIDQADTRFQQHFSVMIELEDGPDSGTQPCLSMLGDLQVRERSPAACFMTRDEEDILVSDYREFDNLVCSDLDEMYIKNTCSLTQSPAPVRSDLASTGEIGDEANQKHAEQCDEQATTCDELSGASSEKSQSVSSQSGPDPLYGRVAFFSSMEGEDSSDDSANSSSGSAPGSPNIPRRVSSYSEDQGISTAIWYV